ncbi:uncharacterized protein LTR77_000009 [Saxophila tyrrhenica]|uniref:Biotin carboxylase n=1 Tax=Saxophila tyrrhenica TaxID=1690608 RepID=A0AAV9PNI3_9PEZI|nr:hypothetical protein LTR77_000009 [Saxophila tyrrhenica]
MAWCISEKIVCICKAHGIGAVLPGYGFLSENAEFAKMLSDHGIVFAGPSPKSIMEFGLKHRARELARVAGVPLVPGTGIITSQQEAASEAQRIGYPVSIPDPACSEHGTDPHVQVMVKATAGGGGMGLVVCHGPEKLAEAVTSVRSRGKTLFKDDGLFLERYVGNARHIEGQIFGNGQGHVLWFGERECSIQRRHQKVVEEAPSSYVERRPELREKLRLASTALAASSSYKSAGTIEYLVDDTTGEFFFLEMNTRLQVEHGVTEAYYNTDLVRLMLLQAQAEVEGKPGLSAEEMQQQTPEGPKGHAIEVRVYAENPAADYMPAPGLFMEVSFPKNARTRVDTWLERGSVVTPYFGERPD